MRLVDAAPRALVVATLIAGSAWAAEPQYGKVETFEPGKKYTCVPTADRKGWDCKEAAPKDGSAPASSAPPVALPAPTAQAPAASAPAMSPASATPRPTSIPPASIAPSPPANPAAQAPRNAGLPSYLRAPGSSSANVAPPAAAPTAPVQCPRHRLRRRRSLRQRDAVPGSAGIAAASRNCSCCRNIAGSSAGRRTAQGGRHRRAGRRSATCPAEPDAGGATGGHHADIGHQRPTARPARSG